MRNKTQCVVLALAALVLVLALAAPGVAAPPSYVHRLAGRPIQAILASDGALYAGDRLGEGVHRSLNQGQDWAAYGQGLGLEDVMALAQRGDYVLAGTWGEGVYQRKPADAAWSPLRSGMKSDHRSIRALVCTAGASPTVYAADPDQMVYRLLPGASSWEQLPAVGFPSLAPAANPPGAQAPSDRDQPERSKDREGLSADAPDIYCLGLDPSGQLHAGLSSAGVYVYSDAQRRWEEKGALDRSCYALVCDNTGALWAGATGGVYRWDGAAWVISPGSAGWDVTALQANLSGDCLVAGLRDGSIWRLARASGGWESLGGVGQRVWALGFCQADGGERLLVGAEDGLYYTGVACPPPATATPTRTPTPTPTPICALHVDDFTDTNPANDLGAASSWAAQGGAGCSVNANPYVGAELNLEYNLAAGCAARYATGVHRDVSMYRSLTLEIKGADTNQIADLWVGLSDGAVTTCLKVGDFASLPITTTWQGVSFPLVAFDGTLNLADIETVVIEARAGATSRAGSVQLDRLRLECSQVPLILDRFDDLSNPHALGQNPITGTFGGATIAARYITADTWDGTAGSYELAYSLPSASAWAVCEFPLAPTDLSLYRSLFFRIRGTSGAKVNVWLHDGEGHRSYVDLEPIYATISPSWALVSIPLNDFRPINLKAITTVKFAFEWEPMQGVVALDNLWFAADPLLLDDYCDSDSNNSLNGRAGVFYPPAHVCSPTQVAAMENGALRLNYNIPPINGCFAGYLSNAPLDAEPYQALHLWVRGSANAANASVALEVHDPGEWFDKAKLSDYLPYGIYEEQWQRVAIPFAAFPSVERWDRAQRIVIAFEQAKGAAQGTLWVDEITLNEACAPLWVQNWNDGDLRNAFHLDDSVYYGGGVISQVNAGGHLELHYDVPPGGWAFWRTELRGVDVGDYEHIRFRIKGNITGAAPKLKLRDTQGNERFVDLSRYYGAFPADWMNMAVPLNDLGWGLDLGALAELHIGVDAPGSGVIYLDDLRFECDDVRTWCPPVAVLSVHTK